MNPDSFKFHLALNQAQALYQAGMNQQAAAVFQEAAAMALGQKQIAAHVHCLRWAGNSYLWAFQLEDAYPHLLNAVSYHEHREVNPSDIYSALTDLCLISIRSRGIAEIRQLLAQTRAYIDRQGLARWSHRVDRIEAMLCLRLGDFASAHEFAARAWCGMRTARDGPKYQQGAYLDALFRAAHGLGNIPEMDRAVELFRGTNESDISTSQMRKVVCLGMRYAFDEVTDQNRATIRDLAREAVQINLNAASPFEELPDALRLLLALGAVDEASKALAAKAPPGPLHTALLQLDVRLARITGAAGIPVCKCRVVGVQPAFGSHDISTTEAGQLSDLLAKARELAHAEDQRLGIEANQRAVALRQGWLAAFNIPAALAAAA